MTEPQVTMDVRLPDSGAAVIDIAGEVTAACEPVLSHAYDEASTDGTKLIVLDFTGLDYMNSSGSACSSRSWSVPTASTRSSRPTGSPSTTGRSSS